MINMITFDSKDEWREHRGLIGGSDAGAIVGANPWCSNQALWEIKTGRVKQADISDKPAVKYGTEAEPLLRELYKLKHQNMTVYYEENNMWYNDDFPWAHASLDGWLKDESRPSELGIWECKTTTIKSSLQAEKWKDQIPQSYYIQLLHYMFVTGATYAILNAEIQSDYYHDARIVEYRVERSEVEDDIAYLIEKERDFYDNVKRDIRPALLLPTI